jgi:hypothetical protein
MSTVSRLHQVAILSKLRFVSRDYDFLFQIIAMHRDNAVHSVNDLDTGYDFFFIRFRGPTKISSSSMNFFEHL